MRRVSRPPPSGFSIALSSASQATVPVENRTAEDIRKQLYIHNDDSLVSPIISSDVPLFSFVTPAGSHHHQHHHQSHSQQSGGRPVSPHAHGGHAPAPSAKFIHVGQSSLYVLVDGGSLFHDEPNQVHPESHHPMSLKSGESMFTSGGLRDQVVRDLTSGSAASETTREYDAAIAEVATASSSSLNFALKKRPTPGGGSRPRRFDPQPHLRRSLSNADLEGVEEMARIGGGQQGSVHIARLKDGSKCAMKKIDISDATSALNDVERQGRKAGIVRELNMVKSLRENPSTHLVSMYNASALLTDEQKELRIFMELMSTSVEHLQKTLGRMPHTEVTRITQRAFTKDYEILGSSTSTSGVGRERYFTNAAALDASVDRQTMCPEILLSFIAHDVLRGLHELHTAHRRVHCDVKPANILLSEDKQTFKLGDFGCAVSMSASNGTEVRQRGAVTLGSKIYRAPEQFSSGSFGDEEFFEMGSSSMTMASSTTTSTHGSFVGTAKPNQDDKGFITFDGKVDVWALGITLLELANGCHPTKRFQDDFWNFAAKLNMRDMILPVTCSHMFYDFIEACLCRSRTQRPDAAALLHHPFLVAYLGVSRKSLAKFVNMLTTESEQYQRKVKLESLRLSVVTATRTCDTEMHKRTSQKRWRGFTSLVVKGEPPSSSDLTLFPALGD